MRMLAVITLGLVGGFVGGILLSEVIGIIGYLLFAQAIGIKYLPIFLALVCASIVLVIDRRRFA